MPDQRTAVDTKAFDHATYAEAMRIGERLLEQCETARLDARILLRHAIGADEADLIARAPELMSALEIARYASLLERRREGEPVAYITGVKEFWSLDFCVTPDVLIPRSDSECLIEAAIKRREKNAAWRILDLGTGSGCLLCALLTEFPIATGVGIDSAPNALCIAADNALRLGVSNRAAFLEGSWMEPVRGEFDIIIANPPYIPAADEAVLTRDVSAFEPHKALFGGADGLDPYRAILPKIAAFLANDGLLLLECGFDQTASVRALAVEAGLGGGEIFTLFDLAERPRGLGLDRIKEQNKD